MVWCPVVVVGRGSEIGNVALRATLPLSEPLPTTEYCKGNKTIPEKVATTRTEDGQK